MGEVSAVVKIFLLAEINMVTDKKTSKNSRRTESKPKESTVDQNLDEIDISKYHNAYLGVQI